MKTLAEIHDMIATAHVGDGDKLLNICQALLEQLRQTQRIAQTAVRLHGASPVTDTYPVMQGDLLTEVEVPRQETGDKSS